jgi:hypothetical protein
MMFIYLNLILGMRGFLEIAAWKKRGKKLQLFGLSGRSKYQLQPNEKKAITFNLQGILIPRGLPNKQKKSQRQYLKVEKIMIFYSAELKY